MLLVSSVDANLPSRARSAVCLQFSCLFDFDQVKNQFSSHQLTLSSIHTHLRSGSKQVQLRVRFRLGLHSSQLKSRSAQLRFRLRSKQFQFEPGSDSAQCQLISDQVQAQLRLSSAQLRFRLRSEQVWSEPDLNLNLSWAELNLS